MRPFSSIVSFVPCTIHRFWMEVNFEYHRVRMLNGLKLLVYIFIAFCCSCANGYDGSLMTAILAMPYYKQTFDSGLVGQKVSLLSSLYSV